MNRADTEDKWKNLGDDVPDLSKVKTGIVHGVTIDFDQKKIFAPNGVIFVSGQLTGEGEIVTDTE